jgi:hypothetical protein
MGFTWSLHPDGIDGRLELVMTNPLLEEIWAIKDRLSAEAGGDIHVFCQQLRDWSAKNLPRQMVVIAPSELRALMAEKEKEEGLVLREDPLPYGSQKD